MQNAQLYQELVLLDRELKTMHPNQVRAHFPQLYYELQRRKQNPFKGNEKIFSTMGHDFALGVLKAFSAQDFWRFIRTNTVFEWEDYQQLDQSAPPLLRNMFQRLWRSQRQKLMKYLSAEESIFQMYEHRPDLLYVIHKLNGQATAWLQTLLTGIIRYFSRVYG